MAKRVVHISQLTEDGVYVMALESGDRVLACVASSEWLRDKDGVQNARLIAAAPDMEKALEGAEKILDSVGVRNWAIGWKVALEDVRAALAKAKGETDV